MFHLSPQSHPSHHSSQQDHLPSGTALIPWHCLHPPYAGMSEKSTISLKGLELGSFPVLWAVFFPLTKLIYLGFGGSCFSSAKHQPSASTESSLSSSEVFWHSCSMVCFGEIIQRPDLNKAAYQNIFLIIILINTALRRLFIVLQTHDKPIPWEHKNHWSAFTHFQFTLK